MQDEISVDWRKTASGEWTINSIFPKETKVHLKGQYWPDRYQRDRGYYTYRISGFPIVVGEYRRESDGSELLVFWHYDDPRSKKQVEFNELPPHIQEQVREFYRESRKQRGWLKGYKWLD